MSRLIVLALAAAALATSIASADTIIPGGNISGLWNAAGSPYLIQGNITIPTNETLIIEPGVSVILQGTYKWIVQGWLEAIGTAMDSILITCRDTTTRWYGIKFDDAPDSSHLEYCLIEYSKTWPDYNGGGLYCHNSNPVICHCTLRYHQCSQGVIHCHASDARITYNNIYWNHCGIGGGITVVSGSAPFIGFNNFTENSATYEGGAIVTEDTGDLQIVGNYITGNWAQYGGGLYIYPAQGPQIVVRGNIMADNQATQRGGAIYGGYLEMDDNILFHNCDHDNSPFSSGGIAQGPSPSTITNCILWRNLPTQVGRINTECLHGAYSDVQDGWPGIGNMDSDPMFVAPQYYDFRLQWGSPCIDAGDPNPLNNDPDGTRGDIGSFYYDQSVPVRVLLTPHERNLVIPAQGGSFDFTLWVTNIDPANPTFTVWTDVTLPNGMILSPILGPITVHLDSGQTISRVRSQTVPAGAPRGLYTYNAYAVTGTDTSRDSFSFFKVGPRGGGMVAGNWSNSGEDLAIEKTASCQSSAISLQPCFPNPFNPTTAISYELRAATYVSLKVYDIAGRVVATLVNGWRDAGAHGATFDGSGLASGIYLAKLEAGEFTAVQKLVLMK